MRELLRHRDFRLLLAAQTLSMFGDWTLLLVLGIWAKTLTGSNAVAGLTVFAMVAPGLLAPFAGVVVDRLPRRAVMIGLNLVSAVVVSRCGSCTTGISCGCCSPSPSGTASAA